MTAAQKIIKYAAMAFAIILAVGIIGGIVSAVLSIASLFGIGGGGAVADEITKYSVEGEIVSISLEAKAADLEIKSADSFSVESNLKNLTVKTSGGELKIYEKSTLFKSNDYDGAVLTLYVPEGASLKNVDITTGAGRFTAESLVADDIDLELGAGEVSINNLVAKREIDIEGGAGKITVGGGSLNNLSFEMGVGDAAIRATLSGSSELDLGVGKARITLLGDAESYRVRLEKGIGDARIDGVSVDSSTTVGKGANTVEVNGGVGKIEIVFEN